MRLSFGWWRSFYHRLKTSTQRPHLRIRSILHFLFSHLTRIERRLLAGFTFMAFVSAGGMTFASYNDYLSAPAAGGVYREGIIISSPRDVEPMIAQLTKVGLVQLDEQGGLQPALARDWSIEDDAKRIRVHLTDKLSAEEVIATFANQKESGYWKEAEITAPDAQTLEFRFPRPWAGFISEMITPIFPFGPYVLEKQTTETLTFSASQKALKSPYIPKLELHLFTDPRIMERAIRKGAIEGAFMSDSYELAVPRDWTINHPELTRENLLIFNLRNEVVADESVRQHLVRGEALPEPKTIRVVAPDLPALDTAVFDLQDRWSQLNVVVTLERYPILTLTKSIIPERNYDAILLGVDYGPEGDRYPYWHSSQIAAPGNNLAGFRDKEIDRLLDEARQSPDLAERQKRYEQVCDILESKAVVIHINSPKVTFAHAPEVHSTTPEELYTNVSRWTNIANWYMKEKRVPKSESSS